MLIRQGDVILIATTNPIPPTAAPVARDRAGRIVLAVGETSGHSHAVLDRDAELLAVPNTSTTDLEDRFLRVLADGGVDLAHVNPDNSLTGEHATVHVPAGDWIVRGQREYLPDSYVRVAD